jgi:hypothetical protein
MTSRLLIQVGDDSRWTGRDTEGRTRGALPTQRFSARRLKVTTQFSGHLSAVFDTDALRSRTDPPACRTVGHLGGVPFRLLGDRERPVLRAEGAIER